MDFKISDTPVLRPLVTFLPNHDEPIHNWYWYKEGYSKQFVDLFIDQFQLTKSRTVLDPFSGVGTTCLACKQRGIPSIGFDVSPLCVFAGRVKTADYDTGELTGAVKDALSWKFEKPVALPTDPYFKKAFSKWTLEDAVFLKNKILEMDDGKIRNFLLLALIDSTTESSWTIKRGGLVAIEKRCRPPLRALFQKKIQRMLKNVLNSGIGRTPAQINLGDARKLALEDESIDAVITSPPYLNKIEYTQIYKLELSFFFGEPVTESKMRAFVGSEVKQPQSLDSLSLQLSGYDSMPPIAQAYFYDLALALKEMHRVCKTGANAVIVIGGGCFPDRVICTDVPTAELAEQIGFKVKKILVARETWGTRARTIKIGRIRESAITLKKI